MNNSSNKSVKTVWYITGSVLIFSFIAMKKLMHEPLPLNTTEEEVNYNMPRPDAFIPPYDMSGKKIRTRINGGQNQMTTTTPVLKVISDRKAPAKAVAKKDDKKKTKKTAQKNTEAKKVAQLSTRVVDSSLHASIKADLIKNNFAMYSDRNVNNNYYNNSNTDLHKGTKVEKVKMTEAQWKELLYSQPTQTNAQLYLKAWQAGEVQAASYYQLSGSLLKDENGQRQQLGLYLLKQAVTAESFQILVQNYRESTPEALRAQIYSAMKSYSQPAYFAELNKVLIGKDKTSTQFALQILHLALNKTGNSGNVISAQDNQSARSTRSTTTNQSPSLLKTFVPNLQKLASSDDVAVAQTADGLLQEIQSLTTVATVSDLGAEGL